VKEEVEYLLPSLERLEASVEEDKTVGAECGDALAESLPRVSRGNQTVVKTVWLLRTESVGTTEFSDRGIQMFPLMEK
jgi:hypothetical protein